MGLDRKRSIYSTIMRKSLLDVSFMPFSMLGPFPFKPGYFTTVYYAVKTRFHGCQLILHIAYTIVGMYWLPGPELRRWDYFCRRDTKTQTGIVFFICFGFSSWVFAKVIMMWMLRMIQIKELIVTILYMQNSSDLVCHSNLFESDRLI